MEDDPYHQSISSRRTDINARIVAPKMSPTVGSKPGRGGAVTIQAAKDAEPDGFTIFVTRPICAIPRG